MPIYGGGQQATIKTGGDRSDNRLLGAERPQAAAAGRRPPGGHEGAQRDDRAHSRRHAGPEPWSRGAGAVQPRPAVQGARRWLGGRPPNWCT